ncbi:MAG: hypothetical protein HN712_04225 [Gemmatimonadetes bacterium]|nr:hypothetical protein [Gemmatimonadota bacterium]
MIAFVSDRDGSDDIFVMYEDGSMPTNLTRSPLDWDRDPAWSPNGERIVFVRNGAITIMRADGTDVNELVRRGETPAWSPDGNWIAYTASPSSSSGQETRVVNVNGTGNLPLTYYLRDLAGPAWSPDGSELAVSNGNIALIDPTLDDSEQTYDWVGAPQSAYGVAWAPDGSSLAIHAFGQNRDFDIYVQNPGGREWLQLTNTQGLDADPAWSPDGTKIAFWTVRDDPVQDPWPGNGEIYIMSTDGSNQENITNSAAHDWAPAWRPPRGQKTAIHLLTWGMLKRLLLK